jgi:phospholipid/cholesterol/gamma-HCH transport system permease protein
MIILQVNLLEWLQRLYNACLLCRELILCFDKSRRNTYHLLSQIEVMGIGSLTIVLLASFFIGMVFTFQVAKELISLNATELVGSVLTITFVRELSPVLTAVIVTGRIGSAFTAEIATMKVTGQIDALYVLNTDPLYYLVIPRVHACIFMLPLLNIFALATSLSSSILVSSLLYHIPPLIFLHSSSISILDFCYSLFKATIFGFVIAIISCSWGLSATGGSKSVGKSTTSSVVTTLLVIFVVDFILSCLMFYESNSLLQV